MYIDPFSLKAYAQGRTDELARMYADGRHDQEWLSAKLGQALAALGAWLTKAGNALQPRRQAPVPVVASQPRTRR